MVVADPGVARASGHRLLPAGVPQRAFAVATLVNMTGSGLYLASSALYATRVLGLSTVAAGAALTVTALVGQVAGIPAGVLADRRGARQTYALAKLLGAVAMASLIFARGVMGFAAVCAAVALLSSTASSARGPLVRSLGGEHPIRYRAYLKSVGNLGISAGAIGAGLAIQIDRPAAYIVIIAVNGASSALCGLIVWRWLEPVAQVRPTARGRSGMLVAVRDRRFVAVTALNGLTSIHAALLSFALPLWIVERTGAPRWTVGAAVVINTVLVVVFQVRFSSSVDSASAALRTMRLSGLAFLAMAIAVAFSAYADRWQALVLITVGVVAYTAGELWHATAGFDLVFRFAPAHLQGQYSGLFNAGQGLAEAAGPLVLGLTCIRYGALGWLATGAALAAISTIGSWVVRRGDVTAAGQEAS